MSESKRLLANRYELGDLIGRGGMAQVRVAYDTRLGRTVAIKLLRSEYLRDPSFHTRFRREAQAAGGLNHPSIVAVYDTGEEQVMTSTGERTTVPYIVMEYVEGHTVRDILKDGSAAPIDEAVEIMAGVLSALEYSHAAGLVHRDIKPANVMLTPTGAIKVMDFGIARALADVGQTMTHTQAVVGTAQYLSPEQARGEEVDARSDLYSAGCLLFELLCGRPPFVGESPVAVAYQHVREEPPRPSEFAPDVPAELDQVVMRALAKDPAQRYQTAQEFLADLNAVLAGTLPGVPPQTMGSGSGAMAVANGVAANSAMGTGTGMATTGVDTASNAEPEFEYVDERTERRRQIRNIGILAAAGLLAAAAIFGLFRFVSSPGAGPGVTVVNVPDVVNMTEERAVDTLESFQLLPVVQYESSDEVPQGLVIRTDPTAQTEVSPNSTIAVYVSTGAVEIEIPSVRGLTEEAARALLEDLDLVVIGTETDNSDPVIEEGRVTKTDPAEGTIVGSMSEVILFISSGKILLPDLVGLTREEAESTLFDLGMSYNVTVVQTDSFTEGTVFSQDPEPGLVKVDVTVEIEVATPIVRVNVPDLLGDTEAIAISSLQSLGLVAQKSESFSCDVSAGLVISTTPAAGTEVKEGSSVTYVLSLGEDPDDPCTGGGP